MKRTRIIATALLLNSLIYNAASAEIGVVSAAYLKKICASYDDTPATTADGMCIGYVVGVASVMEFINALCLPARSTHAQAVLVVQKHLYEHPEKLHLNAEELVFDALQDAFPCSKTPTD